MRSFLSGTMVLAAALASAPAARAEGVPPLDPILVTQRPVLSPTPSRFPIAYRLAHPVEQYHYYSCYGHHLSDYNCGSLAADSRFIFGSCRTFWNEPCTKDKPPVLLPDGTPFPLPPGGQAAPGASGAPGKPGCASCRW